MTSVSYCVGRAWEQGDPELSWGQGSHAREGMHATNERAPGCGTSRPARCCCCLTLLLLLHAKFFSKQSRSERT